MDSPPAPPPSPLFTGPPVEWLSVKDAADVFNVSESTLRRHIRANHLLHDCSFSGEGNYVIAINKHRNPISTRPYCPPLPGQLDYVNARPLPDEV